MPNDRPASKKTSWKHDNGAAARKPVRGWQRAPEAGTGAPALPKRPMKLLWAALALLACCAAIIGVIILLSPLEPARLVLVGGSYADNLSIPPNPYGLRSYGDFIELSEREVGLLPFWKSRPIRALHPPVRLEGPGWKNEWQKWPKEVVRAEESGGFREPTVIVFLALHGGSDLEGAYLLADDEVAGRLPIADVLEAMAKLPRDKQKLLILDATQVADDWTLGMLHNGFARGLKSELDKIQRGGKKIENLWVLAASDEDQRSWIDVAAGRSIFSRLVVEGLRGEADDDEDGRIDLRELYEHVRPKVKDWVFENRGDVQTPILLPADDAALALAADVELSHYKKADGKADAALPSPGQAGPGAPAAGSSEDWWAKYKALRDGKPGPATYSPQLWRRFKDTLIRRDQLLAARSSETAKLENLEAALRGLESRIRAASGPLELADSQYGTLVMKGARGEAIPEDDPDRKTFDELLSKPEGQFSAAWDEMIGGRDGPDLRARFGAYLMDRLAGQGQGLTVDRVARLLARYSNTPSRPAEVHFLLMAEAQLQRLDPGSRARPDLIRRAVGIRRLAEKAALAIEPGGYSYSEELVPWIRAGVERADRERRRGEDLLFATDAERWDEAGRAFDRAEQGYEQARGRAAAVREALELRNRVLDELPDYTRWWARRTSVAEDPRRANGPIPGDEEFTRSLESLWEKVHRLALLLEGPSEAVDPAPLTREVRLGFEAVEGRFVHDLRDLDRTQLPRDWVAEVALAVPFVGSGGVPRAGSRPFPDRDRLPLPLRPGAGPAPDAPTGSGGEALERELRVKGRATTQGRLALAVLGRRAFDDEVLGKDLTRYDALLEMLKAAPEKSDWWESIAYAGRSVADRWDRMPAAVEARLVAAEEKKNVAPSEAPLRDADRLARQLAGAAALKRGPAEEARKRRMHDLLVWMAGRSLEDHWFDERPDAVPYYRKAGLRFANDAQALAPESRAVAAIREELNRPGTLVIEGPKDIVWTSEPQMELSYEVRTAASPRVSTGAAVVWGEPGDAKLLRQLEPAAGGRTVLDVGGDGGPPPVRYTLRSPLLEAAEADAPRKPDVMPASFRVRAFFRGQAPEFATEVRLFPAPDSTLIDPPGPPRGSVTVRADDAVMRRFGNTNAVVTIVLDASGSMGERGERALARGPTYGKFVTDVLNNDRLGPAEVTEAIVRRLQRSKYAEALTALEEILRKIPRGTRVSLWVFGKAVGPLHKQPPPDAKMTIERVQALVAWDPGNRAQLAEVMGKIRPPAIIPYNDTPIVEAMVQARGDLRGASGFKTLVVLTDGGESEEKSSEAIRQRLRREFRDEGITIDMVCFKADHAEQKKAEGQFREILEELGGKFQLADNITVLAQRLNGAIARNLSYRVDRTEHVPAADAGRIQELPVGRPNAADAWHPLLDAGHFGVVVDAIPRTSQVQLKGGDRLLLRLIEAKDGRVRFERGLYADEPDFRGRPFVKQNGWHLAVLQDRLERDRTLNMTVSLERIFDPAEVVLEQLEPREVWMELEPAGGDRGVVGLRWSGREDYPAAAWQLSVPEWPEDANGGPIPARLRAWWDKDSKAPPAARLDRKDFDNPLDIRRREVAAGGLDTIEIESVTIEDRRVPGGPDGPVSCLVVRVRHAPDRPVWVRLGGISPRNAQHRFYAHAGRYTGVFWPLIEDQVRPNVDAIEVVSVEAFRKRARARGDFIEIGGAGNVGLIPDPADRGLPPPIAIAE